MRLAPLLALAALTAIAAQPARAERPRMAVTADPPVSRNGESVKVRYLLTYLGREKVTPPKMPVLTDWDLSAHFPSESTMDILHEGKITRKQTFDTTFILKPLRVGKLRIPGLDYYVGSTRYSTSELFVEVERLPGGVQTRPRAPVTQRRPFNPFDPNAEDLYDVPAGPQPRRNPPQVAQPRLPLAPRMDGLTETQRRETFFIRAEHGPTQVYVGQMIEISYAMYERSPVVADPEVSKFPDFKGFLKENLLVPKVFTRTPTALDGESFLRSELIRYAVFPLKAGKLEIQPMSLRATFVMSPEERNARIMLGQPIDPREITGIRTMKHSRSIEVEAKPLPPAPTNARFTGGVGQFNMTAVWPSGGLKVDQPFNITVTLRGRGNFGAIQEPELGLPDHVEAQPAKAAHKFEESGQGQKTFEYVLLPKRPGPIEVGELRWTYFDPKQEKYVDVSVPGFSLSVEGGVPGTGPKEAPQPQMAPLTAGPQVFIALDRIREGSPWVGRTSWGLLTLLHAALAFLFVRRRQDDSQEAFYRSHPWERTARRIREDKKPSPKGTAVLVDQWIRERLAGALGRPELHGESSRDEITAALRDRLHPERHKLVEPLRRFIADLDVLRFTGSNVKDAMAPEAQFQRAQALVEPIVAALPQAKPPEDDSDDEDEG